MLYAHVRAGKFYEGTAYRCRPKELSNDITSQRLLQLSVWKLYEKRQEKAQGQTIGRLDLSSKQSAFCDCLPVEAYNTLGTRHMSNVTSRQSVPPVMPSAMDKWLGTVDSRCPASSPSPKLKN